MNKVQAIEAITRDILAGLYGTTQNCGTETQKYTARKLIKLHRGCCAVCLETGIHYSRLQWVLDKRRGGIIPQLDYKT